MLSIYAAWNMNRILVWDIPTRLFHWLFAAAFVAAFGIATLVDDDSPAFAVHMVLGLVMLFMVVLRVVWGLVGSRYARFGSFLFGPAAVLRYLRDAFTGRGERHVGHNPGSSLAIYAMLALTAGLAVTGVLRSSGGEIVEELHEVLAWAFVAVVAVHVAGVVWHVVRHRENLPLSMIDGRKEGEATQGIASSHPLAGVLFLGLVGAWSWRLSAGYDPTTGQLEVPLTGRTIQLGEGGEGRGDLAPKGDSGKEHRRHDDDD